MYLAWTLFSCYDTHIHLRVHGTRVTVVSVGIQFTNIITEKGFFIIHPTNNFLRIMDNIKLFNYSLSNHVYLIIIKNIN